MAHDIMSQFYTCLNYPLHEKLSSLTRIIDQSSANKDLQALFPQLINNIFASSFSNGWGLRTVTCETSRYEYELLISFLEPQGPMFRLCYKLLSDPQLKYNLPLNALPMDLQMALERGRSSQFYSDMLATDAQTVNIVALALNPFDFYIFNFALHLVSHSQNKSSWENWNSAYFALACDYLMHFLPADPNMPVLPHIPNYTGKVHMTAPLQTANRPFSQHAPSLLIIPDLPGISNQHAPPQNQSRNEVWRSETVLHVFMDIWMCVEQFNARSVEMYQRNYAIANSSPERVRTVRVLVKHVHSFSANLSDPASRSCALRKYARQIMSARAYHYVKHLVTTWPLDASFRLVMELWLSLIQPWRYTDNVISQDRFPSANNNQEEVGLNALDASFTQFIAENYPAYTCIFQLVLPRFVMLDLTSYKNAVMLFRLGKVFSQPQLVSILKGLEKAITLNSSGFYCPCPDSSYNRSSLDQSYSYNGMALQKWVAVAKQAISELNLSTNFEYDPIWTENKKHSSLEFVKKIIAAKLASEKNMTELNKKINQQHQGLWAGIKHWLMLGGSIEDELAFEECKKVPNYLNATIHFFTDIFGLQEASLMQLDPVVEDISEHSSFANSSQFPLSITNKLRGKSKSVDYMGDPDLMPITTYENTILIRMFHQIATRLNEVYQQEFSSIWSRTDFWGYVAREVLQKPRAIRTYMRDSNNRQSVVTQHLPARLSLRRLGSHAVVAWFIIGAITIRMFFDCGCLFYTFLLFIMWASFVLTKASFKLLRIMS